MSEERKEKLLNIKIPSYSIEEEKLNWMSHLLGMNFGFVMLLIFIFKIVTNNLTVLQSISLISYSLATIILYLVSTLYHYISPLSPYKRIFRLLDHNIIFLLIWGTYFPVITFSLFPDVSFYIILGIETFALISGMTLNFIDMSKKWIKVYTTLLYVIMGWVLVCCPLTYQMDTNAFLFILFGGIAFTVGVLFYIIGKNKKWFHSIFHIFVLLGSILQFVGVYLLIG